MDCKLTNYKLLGLNLLNVITDCKLCDVESLHLRINKKILFTERNLAESRGLIICAFQYPKKERKELYHAIDNSKST